MRSYLEELCGGRDGARIRLRRGDPREAVLDTAREQGSDLIVVGSHSRPGPTPVLLGTVAEAVARRAGCDVLVVRVPEVSWTIPE